MQSSKRAFTATPFRPRFAVAYGSLLFAAAGMVACGPQPLVGDASDDRSQVRDVQSVDGAEMDVPTMEDRVIPPTDGSSDGGPAATLVITTCPGDALPSLASGTCQVMGNGPGMLITGDILTPGQVFRGGQVAVNAMGRITCVGCDCAAMAMGATQIVCPDGVVSPGLINAHEHLTFDNQPPATLTDERYEHRHDWRTGHDGHRSVPNRGGSANANQLAWIELRHVMGGATSVNGSGGTTGFLRNLDANSPASTNLLEGAPGPTVNYDTFPYGDASGTELRMGCVGANPPLATETMMGFSAYTPHIAEGIEQSARNEFLCARMGANDIVQAQSAFIHGVALLPVDIAEMARDNTDLIWSPRSNISLYGDTAHVTEFARMGVNIALGTDWLPSGSMNVPRELKCADTLNRNFFGGFFTDEQLWLMTTRNAATALGFERNLGTLANGQLADISIFDARMQRDHRAVIEASPSNVALVLRGGTPLYGDADVVGALPNGMMCETLDVCGTMKRACVSTQPGGRTLAAIQTANMTQYPLFFCGGMVMNEPSCLPARTRVMAPAASVNGSTVYTGMSSMNDTDGDGIANAMDNCPTVFNPIRPIDNMMQGNADMDMLGDACDPCPLNANTTMCTPPDANDRDGDGVPNAMDNCPDVANRDQADADMDGLGDACDPCPMVANPGGMMCPGLTLTIPQVRNPMSPMRPTMGMAVTLNGNVVTAIKNVGTTFGFFIQDRMATDFAGIYVYTGNVRPTVAVGDVVNAAGVFTTFQGLEQLDVRAGMARAMGTAMVPAPIVVTPADIRTGGPRAMSLQSMLLRVNNVTCTGATPAVVGGMMIATDFLAGVNAMDANSLLVTSFVASDVMAPPAIRATMGQMFMSITGVGYAFGMQNKLAPRNVMDLQ